MKINTLPVVPAIIGFGIMVFLSITHQGCRDDAAGPSLVALRGVNDKEIVVQVEVASRPEERARGLMFRRELPENAGMLFVYPAEDRLSFWMKNTFLPLDMIFINNDLRIVGIIENAVPLTLEPRAVDLPARYVLEVNALFARRHGISLGSKVRFNGIHH